MATVSDRTTPHGVSLVDGSKRTAEEWKRNFIREEGTDEGTEDQFFLDVVQTMLWVLESGRIVAGGVFRTRRFRKIRIPAIRNCGDQFICVEVRCKSEAPNLGWKRRRQEGNAGTVHVRRGSIPTFDDLIEETGLK